MYANPLNTKFQNICRDNKKKIVLIVCEKDLKHRIYLCNMFVFFLFIYRGISVLV